MSCNFYAAFSLKGTIMHAAPKHLAAIAACTIAIGVTVQSVKPVRASSPPDAVAGDKASPIYGVTIPAGYRQWEVVAPSHEAFLDELRVILGNPIAIKAYREGKIQFPDGTILAKVAWKHVPSSEDNGALGQFQAFVPGHATTLQFMVKDSRRYASTGGWGFGRFIDGKPVDEEQHKTCFPCHADHAKGHDFVFTRYAP
jgi:Cytochrome P460